MCIHSFYLQGAPFFCLSFLSPTEFWGFVILRTKIVTYEATAASYQMGSNQLKVKDKNHICWTRNVSTFRDQFFFGGDYSTNRDNYRKDLRNIKLFSWIINLIKLKLGLIPLIQIKILSWWILVFSGELLVNFKAVI